MDDNLIKTGDLHYLLERSVTGKRFLLVIDDFWEHMVDRDMFLKFVSRNGKRGSKILLITCPTSITDLPHHVLLNIFSRLPVRSVQSSKCVCKEWNGLIKEPFFSKMHFDRAAMYPMLRAFEPRFWPSDLHLIEATNPNDLVAPLKLHSKLIPPQVPLVDVASKQLIPKFGIVNSCNGLLCVCTTPFNNPIYVCNPITGEYINLPKPERNPYDTDYFIMDKNEMGELCMMHFVFSGFGFSPKTNQYKVMRLLDLETEESERYIAVQVLTLGSSSWRTVSSLERWRNIGLEVLQRQTWAPIEAPYKRSFCVYLNGAVHWLPNRKYATLFIGCFDFDNENIREILPPKEFIEGDRRAIGNMRLGVLHDCLYLTDTTHYAHFHIWVLKDYNDPLSWTKELVIDTLVRKMWPTGLYKPIRYLDNGDLLMFHPSNSLVCYSPKEQSLRYFKIQGIDSDFEMVFHIPSLVPMKDVINVEDPQVEILNVRDSVRLHGWKEFYDFALVEKDEEAISAKYSKIVERNTPFSSAFTKTHM
ncbi:F-box protein At3g07870-like [Gastrolobium bilobum]|uniref:F-box protein At3g07870-like n=1 Tax=Gastrolobium bilobum TaxID=150636 RepID=UPI002AB194F0|nr:F-box protein At3g07870-like [Gastrolobium bilobum]